MAYVQYGRLLHGNFHTMKSETRIFFRMATSNQELMAGADVFSRTSGDSYVEEGQLHFVTCMGKGLIKKLFVRAILSITLACKHLDTPRYFVSVWFRLGERSPNPVVWCARRSTHTPINPVFYQKTSHTHLDPSYIPKFYTGSAWFHCNREVGLFPTVEKMSMNSEKFRKF